MKKIFFLLLLGLLVCTSHVSAQYNKYYFYWMGQEYLIDNKYEEAIETLNILLKVDPTAYEGFVMRGVAKYNLDDLLGAEADFTTAIRRNPVYTRAYYYRAITRTQLGNYDDALKDFQEAIDLRPDQASSYYTRGMTYFLSGQYEKAIEDFDQFMKHETKFADAYILRGKSYLALGDTTRAFREYETAIRTNREYPASYNERGILYLNQKEYDNALADFNKAIENDSTYLLSYFNRAIVYSSMIKPALAIEDLNRVITLDSTISVAYFNRGLIRTQIGDYNRALTDFDRVAENNPNNVLVFYNRAHLHMQLGNIYEALDDFNKAISLYPDFANAYLDRSYIRELLQDNKGARQDRNVAERKISEYRSKLNDSTFSIYADTSRKFNRLMAFDSKFGGRNADRLTSQAENISLMPLYKFTLFEGDVQQSINPLLYYSERVEKFDEEMDMPLLQLSNRDTNISADSLVAMDKRFADAVNQNSSDWTNLFRRGVTQSLIRQYTNAISNYTAAIDRNPVNPFLYINRSTTQSEMIDFIASIDNSYQRMAIDADPASTLKKTSTRIYNYDEAIGDLNKAAKLYPEFAHIYYNRGTLYALSGKLPEAYDDLTKAIELNPNFAEAYFNRGLVQIYLKDTRKGCLDVSKAGELGIKESYTVLKRFAYSDNED